MLPTAQSGRQGLSSTTHPKTRQSWISHSGRIPLLGLPSGCCPHGSLNLELLPPPLPAQVQPVSSGSGSMPVPPRATQTPARGCPILLSSSRVLCLHPRARPSPVSCAYQGCELPRAADRLASGRQPPRTVLARRGAHKIASPFDVPHALLLLTTMATTDRAPPASPAPVLSHPHLPGPA